MQPIRLFDMASQQAHWLSIRQAVIADNVANANTPGFEALDVVPFNRVLDNTQLELAATNPAHIAPTATESPSETIKPADNWEVTNSGNSVSVEQQMMHGSEVNRAFSLNTGILKAFHSLFMASAK